MKLLPSDAYASHCFPPSGVQIFSWNILNSQEDFYTLLRGNSLPQQELCFKVPAILASSKRRSSPAMISKVIFIWYFTKQWLKEYSIPCLIDSESSSKAYPSHQNVFVAVSDSVLSLEIFPQDVLQPGFFSDTVFLSFTARFLFLMFHFACSPTFIRNQCIQTFTKTSCLFFLQPLFTLSCYQLPSARETIALMLLLILSHTDSQVFHN